MNIKTDRADKVLVARGFFQSRSAAQAAIKAGQVQVGTRTLSKVSEVIARDAAIVAEPVHPWVSRGGIKLDHALSEFDVQVEGKNCLDIGASTGGFTQVLLERGAAHVAAVDVGRDQLHRSLRDHPKVTVMEQTDARQLTSDELELAPELVVCDASFIGLEKLLAIPLSLVAPNAVLVTLFKPQFQLSPADIGKGGLVKESANVADAEIAFVTWLEGQGWTVLARADSPITGGDGNRERLIHAQCGGR